MKSCLSGAAQPRCRSALEHQLHLISSLFVLPEHTWATHSQGRNSTAFESWVILCFSVNIKKLAQGTKQNLGSCSEARLWLTPGAFCWEQNRDPPQTAAFLKMHWGVSPGGSRRSKCCKINLSKLDQIRPLKQREQTQEQHLYDATTMFIAHF